MWTVRLGWPVIVATHGMSLESPHQKPVPGRTADHGPTSHGTLPQGPEEKGVRLSSLEYRLELARHGGPFDARWSGNECVQQLAIDWVQAEDPPTATQRARPDWLGPAHPGIDWGHFHPHL
ncbi:uncharacterized protein B0T23DRAFT_391864 [Neurospora hispaniola]|uniref:Uncharacterized protein n=1 Tax=Neurospora hispaniola TaxID=588809 RepID=A0AAJ0IF31_9PEZI|nr:hypothetical protein B0T23DRAFT_391864 [Neurospora hispaniola]